MHEAYYPLSRDKTGQPKNIGSRRYAVNVLDLRNVYKEPSPEEAS